MSVGPVMTPISLPPAIKKFSARGAVPAPSMTSCSDSAIPLVSTSACIYGAFDVECCPTTSTLRAEHCVTPSRANKAVQDSKGVVRHDSAGGASKALFKKLPGVGAGMAKRWYDLGCR